MMEIEELLGVGRVQVRFMKKGRVVLIKGSRRMFVFLRLLINYDNNQCYV